MSHQPHALHANRVSTRLDPELRLALERAAADHGWTVSDYLRRIIEVATAEYRHAPGD